VKSRRETEPSQDLATLARSAHLQQLEAESIHILREVVAELENPVLLYSIGKDSSVILQLALKAFYPGKPPFPLLHVDSTWEFREMIEFRENYARGELGLNVIAYVNDEGVQAGINPFDHGSKIYTDVMRTQPLKQALTKFGFDAAIGGGRRDEERSRAKERVFSFRDRHHRWDPRNQRPELWNLYNTWKRSDECLRVFPLSNWTELDVWQYILQERIPIVPLYFAKMRPVVHRNGDLIVVDDQRMRLRDGETPLMKQVRFRTLGCYPVTGAIESSATTVEAIVHEMLTTRSSERQGRAIDRDESAAMERKKREGYF
jgi:sulfate adenylyltransferase subunit 2